MRVGGWVWITLLLVNLVLWWLLMLRGQVSPELAAPIVIGMALLLNLPSCIPFLYLFGILAGVYDAEPALAQAFIVCLIVSAYGAGYLQWFLGVPWLIRRWRGRRRGDAE
ncbi:MAG TPA: hypothetical protein VN493_22240 [Thermoanaerobaculia bacterium]|nr:hypothetical protein [Thermoanaerobaculia bacterium]